MTRRALLLVAVLAVASVVVCVVPFEVGGLSLVGAVLLACVLPGCAVTAALFASGTLGGLARTTLSLGLSLALAAIGAVLLNLAPGGIQAGTWALLLGGVTILGCIGASLRGPRYGGTEAGAARGTVGSPRELLVSTVLLALAAILAVGAVGLSATTAQDLNQASFTQFWLLPTKREDELVVGIRNADERPLEGRLVVLAGETQLEERNLIHLEPGRTLEFDIDVGDVASNVPVVAVLYRLDDPTTPHRTARLWLP